MKGLLLALKPGKAPPESDKEMEEAPDSKPGMGDDYKQVAKDAAKDGDWDAMIDALCAYIEAK